MARLDAHAHSDCLGQKLLSLTAPGVPDVYQGTELWDDSLVDPDNRRPVDYAARREALDARERPQDPGRHARRCDCAASSPDDLPRRRLPPGARRGCRPPQHLVAFLRGDDVLVAVQPVDGRDSPKPVGATRR